MAEKCSVEAEDDMSEDINLEPLSKRARCIAGLWFGMGMKTSVTHHLRESQPSLETRMALTELMEAGVISEEPFNRYGGLVYKPLVNCRPAWMWLHENIEDPDLKFQVMEPTASQAS